MFGFSERCLLEVSTGRRLTVRDPVTYSFSLVPYIISPTNPTSLTLESLRDYFSQFGEVLETTVMRDATTGRSRGFGFLTFKDPKTVNIVMVKEHYLDGKIVSTL